MEMTGLRYIADVATLHLDASVCNGCGMCVHVCPHAVFARSKGIAEIVDRDACIECGACAINCPEGALSVSPGVGCAWAILKGWVRRTRPTC